MHADEIALQLQTLWQRSVSIRQVIRAAGKSAPMISVIERGRSAPSLATVQKTLAALGTDLSTFFAGGGDDRAELVFRREQMRAVRETRSYTIAFPRRDSIALQMFDEMLTPGQLPEYESPACDVGGRVLSSTLALEIENRKIQELRPGDLFYIPQVAMHRGYAIGDEPVRLISFCHPADY